MQLVVQPFSISSNVVPFVSQDELPISYLYFLVNKLVETKEYKRHWTELTNKEAIIASNDYVTRFTAFSKCIFKYNDCLMKKNFNLHRTRDLLLPKLISGEIDVENLDIETEVAA